MKTQINKSELFKAAWKTYRDYNGQVSFSDCLSLEWNLVRGIITNGITKESSVSDVKEVVYRMPESTDFLFILTEVKNNSNGFQKDIAIKGLNGRHLSEKQAWCVAYEFKNVA